jgi:alpha-beta hydrolase superfamily lysophospholipase
MKILLTGVTVPKPRNECSPENVGLDFEAHRMDGTDGAELEAWYVPRESSRGLVVVFHGYASCKAEVLREAAAFHELGYATFLVDFRGSGGSSGWNTSVGVYEADDVEQAWNYVGRHWPDERRILFGQSMGAAAILRAVPTRELRPAALVLECPFDRLTATVGNRFTAMGLPATPFAQLLVFWGGVQQGFNGFQHNPAEYAKSVTVNTLLLHGDRDLRVTRQQAANIFDNLAGPKEFSLFAGAGHESYVTHDAAQWKHVVRQFLHDDE